MAACQASFADISSNEENFWAALTVLDNVGSN
jgi:hypothetical protein